MVPASVEKPIDVHPCLRCARVLAPLATQEPQQRLDPLQADIRIRSRGQGTRRVAHRNRKEREGTKGVTRSVRPRRGKRDHRRPCAHAGEIVGRLLRVRVLLRACARRSRLHWSGETSTESADSSAWNEPESGARTRDTTKTHRPRDLSFLSVPPMCSRRQRARTELAGGAIFHNPTTGKPWADEQVQRRYFEAAMKRLGIRYRAPKQTRHTFATMCLMAGADPAWVARQLGHASSKDVFEVYSRWIEGADKGLERGKVEAWIEPAVGWPAQIEGVARRVQI